MNIKNIDKNNIEIIAEEKEMKKIIEKIKKEKITYYKNLRNGNIICDKDAFYQKII